MGREKRKACSPGQTGNDEAGEVPRRPRSLTEADKIEVFRTATRSLVASFADGIAKGLSDQSLANALEAALGIFGGSSGPDRLSVVHTGSALRIWGGWHIVNHFTEKPLFSGRRTIETARVIYPSRTHTTIRSTCSDPFPALPRSGGVVVRARL
jgi:hypothetical protein